MIFCLLFLLLFDVIYLFIQRRLSTQDKITKQQQNDNVTAQSKVPIKVQNIQNIKSQY